MPFTTPATKSVHIDNHHFFDVPSEGTVPSWKDSSLDLHFDVVRADNGKRIANPGDKNLLKIGDFLFFMKKLTTFCGKQLQKHQNS